ncbi:OmpA family protein [Croceivirga thetidis]|uniref:OmpA family protein n=1 Tax=Croceivirga thetidis TaxID=2721623 RepID=A0ABX1GQQ0_9FLAO|nr:OmpA family protein [Croceivirga thetidis]NKI31406.1 OmpA family protein [Croceivirga thetidis]
MTKNLVYPLGMLIAIILGTYLYFTLCSDCALSAVSDTEITEEENVPAVVEPEPTSFPLSFKDGDFAFEIDDNFNFDLSSANFKNPIASGIDGGIDQLKGYLAENEGKIISITGLYRDDETNPTAFPNLGLARANRVKNYFVEQGIPSSQTATFGRLMNDLLPLNGVLLGPIDYKMDVRAEDAEEKLSDLLADIKADPLKIYFETGEASINLSSEQRQKIAKIASYLDQVPDAKCLVIGHTDNTGSRSTNIALAQERADFIRDYLAQNGIPADKTESSSKGPDAPIASNSTEEGRALNRRVEVTLN